MVRRAECGGEGGRGAGSARTSNLSNAKAVGEGVLEYRIDWGPGYRVYFGRDGEVLAILLTGGSEQRQQRDIDAAKASWADYKRRRSRAK